jgi:hypothetical protein
VNSIRRLRRALARRAKSPGRAELRVLVAGIVLLAGSIAATVIGRAVSSSAPGHYVSPLMRKVVLATEGAANDEYKTILVGYWHALGARGAASRRS